MTDPALADLDDIFDYIAADNPQAAERFIRHIVDDLTRIADLGVTGVSREWIRPGLRLHIVGNYCAYFRIDGAKLVVLRIVHGARDVDAIIFEPEH